MMRMILVPIHSMVDSTTKPFGLVVFCCFRLAFVPLLSTFNLSKECRKNNEKYEKNPYRCF